MARLLIANPFASGVSEDLVRRVERALAPVEVSLTARSGHASELAAGAAGAEAVYVLGGDGVMNEVLNGLPAGVPLGVLPGGHTNVLARSLGTPRDPVEAARRLRSLRRISLGRVNGRRFAFAAGIGVDSHAVRTLEGKRRVHGKRPGDLAYARVVAAHLLRGYGQELELVGVGPVAVGLVSNDAIFTYAGPLPLRISPAASYELGLDLAAPERLGRRQLPALLPRIAAGRGLAGSAGVHTLHDADRFELRCTRPLPLQADGEDLGDVTEALFEAERCAVDLLVARG